LGIGPHFWFVSYIAPAEVAWFCSALFCTNPLQLLFLALLVWLQILAAWQLSCCFDCMAAYMQSDADACASVFMVFPVILNPQAEISL